MSITKASSRKTAATDDSLSPWPLSTFVWASVAFFVVYLGVSSAYKIRLFAIQEYGPVIHEFDPYFNFRAAEVSK
jgi:dolichyl-diphosphooligosaccharide--protein glycosyltransferase